MFKISKIESFKNFLEKERPLNKGVLTKLESNLKTNFIYNSNAIEGNTLTLKETDIILQYGVTVKDKSLKEHEEVKGQEYAINFLKEIIKKMKNGYPITVIRNDEREEYYTALEIAQAKADVIL